MHHMQWTATYLQPPEHESRKLHAQSAVHVPSRLACALSLVALATAEAMAWAVVCAMAIATADEDTEPEPDDPAWAMVVSHEHSGGPNIQTVVHIADVFAGQQLPPT